LTAHFWIIPSENRKILARASLRGVGQRTRRTARQRDAEVAARTAADHRDLAAVRLDEFARDGESQPRALDAAALRGLAAAAEEEVEDRLALFRRHAGAGVHHLDHRFAAGGARAHGDRAARGRELDGIRDEIIHDRAQLLR